MKQVEEEDVIISFNYDTILDSALRKLGKLADSGYDVDFHKVSVQNSWASPELSESKIKLFKLHGSLNWLRCIHCSSKYLYRVVPTFESLYAAEMYNSSECPRCHNRSLMVTVVPPLIGKTYKDYDVSFLWSEAYHTVSKNRRAIDEVIVIGYRLPESDIASLLLFREVILPLLKDPNVKLKIVNPDNNIVDRYSRLLLRQNPVHFNNLDEYLV